jgi:hypothetical protein
MSPERLNFISAYGSGLLVGTALIVIIPEGVDALFETDIAPIAVKSIHKQHKRKRETPLSRLLSANANDTRTEYTPTPSRRHQSAVFCTYPR